MDINTKSECELGLCDGSGIVLKANGPDDFDEEFCLCEVGQSLDERTADHYEPECRAGNPIDASAVLNWFNA